VYMKAYARPGTADGWHFLTGDVNSIKALTSAVGFRYVYDPHTNQFAHASAIYIVTPQGKMSKYFYGIDYSAKDIRFGLIEASKNKIGNAVDQVLLFCYHYDASTGKYTPVAMSILRLAGGATVLLLGGFVAIMLRRESKLGARRAA
ncbi:MAG: SCO family protein, partial [Acidobacteriota bacterium]|nr:SCO family protein [Acidobacteriota bacterium]